MGLAAILERMARDSNLRQELGHAARQRAVEHFSLEGMIERYHNLYIELARNRGVLTVRQG
jgi:glycosyltransferase involved in cell wall biosynthesis